MGMSGGGWAEGATIGWLHPISINLCLVSVPPENGKSMNTARRTGPLRRYGRHHRLNCFGSRSLGLIRNCVPAPKRSGMHIAQFLLRERNSPCPSRKV